MVDLPVPEGVGCDVRPLERVLHQVEDLLHAQRGERLRPETHRPFLALLGEDILVVALAIGHEQTVVVGVKKVVARALHAVVVAHRSFNRREEFALVVAVKMDLISVAVGRDSP